MKNLLLTAEKWFTVLSLLLYSGGPLTLMLNGGVSEGSSGAAVNQDVSLILFLFLVNYAISLSLLILRWRKAIYTCQRDWLFYALMGYIALSFVWSETPSVSLQQIIALIGTSIFAIYLASRFSIQQQLNLLAQMFAVAILLSIVFILVFPHYGIMGGIHVGAWRGIYTHKNVLGKMMTLSTLIFGQLAINTPRLRQILLCGMGLSTVLILFSRSTSSIIGLIILLSAILLLILQKYIPRRYDLIFSMLTGFALLSFSGGTYLVSQFENIVRFFGKDPTFTGRTGIWQTAFDMLETRWLLGYGYGGFLKNVDIQSKLSSNIQLGVHNGFLEFTLDLGLLGLLLLLIWFFVTFMKTLFLLTQSKSSYEHYWPVLFMLNLGLVNVGESTLMMRNDLFCVVSIALSFSIRLLTQQNRLNLYRYKEEKLLTIDR